MVAAGPLERIVGQACHWCEYTLANEDGLGQLGQRISDCLCTSLFPGGTAHSPPSPDKQRAAQLTPQGVQAYGLYKIGEIIGRRHLIGYNVPANAAH